MGLLNLAENWNADNADLADLRRLNPLNRLNQRYQRSHLLSSEQKDEKRLSASLRINLQWTMPPLALLVSKAVQA